MSETIETEEKDRDPLDFDPEESIYHRGYQDGANGYTEFDNPFPKKSREAVLWDDGWADGYIDTH